MSGAVKATKPAASAAVIPPFPKLVEETELAAKKDERDSESFSYAELPSLAEETADMTALRPPTLGEQRMFECQRALCLRDCLLF